MSAHPVLIGGEWRAANASGQFQVENPATGETLPDAFPISTWADCDAALDAATDAAEALRRTSPDAIARFLTRFAERIEERAAELVDVAHLETALARKPRLADVELPRTTGQLRQGAAAAIEGSWALPTIDTTLGIRSMLAPIGPVWVFGPNNFPFAFNSVSGGDFVAAIAAGNPVIAKANSSHPNTTRVLGEEAFGAVRDSGLHPATVQLLYRTGHDDGARAVSDPRTGATGYTGSRGAGLTLKAAADAAGKPIYLELSSVNPLLILPGALAERREALAGELVGSCLMGTGQFCTSPSLVVLFAGDETETFLDEMRQRLDVTPPTPLLSRAVARSLTSAVSELRDAGAEAVTGGAAIEGPGYRHANTLLRVSGAQFLTEPHRLQTEAFGNVSLAVIVRDEQEALAVLAQLEGNLTGCIYSDTRGSDDALYARLEPPLRQRVGRLLNDKMPTGVAVSPAMNHGGPYPSTGHPGFTAVGIPAALRRFGALYSYDNVRPSRLPALLRDENPGGRAWRLVDGAWTRSDVTAAVAR
ncbi:MAG TPA: aldehyde dehydrogenase family protein [Gemmatimonadaceae bacterium]|nr:aldehyde dehydrogenase family protein [Gemmatimonadaceae bacterium]